MFSGLKDCIEASIPERFPQGAEKIKLGYFKRLHVNGIRGDLIKLNDGRVLIYNISGNKTYIFDPKDDSFKRTAITDAPNFYSLYYFLPSPNTQLGITLNNGKVLFLAPEIEDDKKNNRNRLLYRSNQ